ncbi:MAG: hypothetical protein JWO98_5387, partial [Frankiales bacterium]|nr:hypothetical protein [Frankiales bacterium]
EFVGPQGFSTGSVSIGGNNLTTVFNDQTLYVAYRDGANANKITVMKLNDDGVSWSIVGNAGFSAGAASSISLAFIGSTPYVAFIDVGNSTRARVMRLNTAGTAWENVGPTVVASTTVSSTGFAIYNSTPYIASAGQGISSNNITVKKLNTAGTSWDDVTTTPISGIATNISLQFNGSTPHIAYTDIANQSRATVMRVNTAGNAWEIVGKAGFSSASVISTNVYLGFNNSKPYLVYRDYGYNKTRIMKLNDAGTDWQEVTASGFSAGMALSMKIVVNGGTPYTVYSDWGNQQKATVMKFNGSQWETVGRAGFSDQSQYNNLPLVFYNNVPYVAYSDGLFSGKATVKRLNTAGTDWETVGTPGFSTDPTDYNCLATDGSALFVAFLNKNSKKVNVMKLGTGDIWQTVGTADYGDGIVANVSLALNGSTPYVAYKNLSGSGVTVAKLNAAGTGWDQVGNASFTASSVSDISLVFNNSIPYVCSTDGVYKLNAAGTTWGKIGIPQQSLGSPSLAFDGNVPYVSFYDSSISGNTQVTRYTQATNTWASVSSGSITAGDALNTSLAIANSKLYIAYDAGGGFVRSYNLGATISSFSPVTAASNATVTITGTGFTGATAVTFGGQAAQSFQVVSATSITAVVGTGASGSVAVTTPSGSISLPGFTYIAPQTITFPPISTVTYGAADVNPAASASSGLTVSYSSSNTTVATIVSGKIHVLGVGSTIITASQSGNSSYSAASPLTQSLTVARAALTITSNNQNKIYGSANPALTASYNGFVNGESQSNLTTLPTLSTTAAAASTVNTYPVTATGAASANYTISYIPGILTVTPAPLTITADNKSRNYGAANPVLTASYTGFVNGDDASKLTTQPALSTTATTNSAPGNYPISASGAVSANYTFTYNSGLLTVIPVPVINTISPAAAITGTIVTITGVNFTGATAVSFGGVAASSFTVVSSTTITAVVGTGASGNVSVTTANGSALLSGFTYVFILPAANFKMSATSATCKGSANGVINITAVQSLSYTATLTGNSINTSQAFTTSASFNNLPAGTYNVCITVNGQPNYQQCFSIVITEPKDLSLYSTVSADNKNVILDLSGGSIYYVELNGLVHTTTSNTLTLPLATGKNDLIITTDKPCQGVIERVITASDIITPYPDPFENTLYLNVGGQQATKAIIEIYSSLGVLVYKSQVSNPSNTIRLDLSSIKITGLYTLKLTMDSFQGVYKILKK